MEKEVPYTMKRILVTGSGGFIGQHLCPALDQLGHTVYAVDREFGGDLCNKEFSRHRRE